MPIPLYSPNTTCTDYYFPLNLWLLALLIPFAPIAHSVSIKNELVVDYFNYFEEQPSVINGRQLVQFRSSVEHSFNSHITAFIQAEAKMDFADERYNDIRLFEGYFDVRFGEMDIRVGKQQIVWGKTDFLNPTDTLTPTDYTDFYDTEDRRQPIAALHSRLFFDSSELELLAQFGFEASYLPKTQSRWLPDLSQLSNGQQLPIVEHMSREPSDSIGTAGLKQSFYLPNFDFALSYLYGWHPVSNADTTTNADALLIDYYYYKRHQLGADFATNIGQIGLRGEAAYTRVIADSDGSDREGGYIQYALGADKTFTNFFYGKDFYINMEILGDENTKTASFQRVSLFDSFDLAVGLKLEIIDGYTWRFSLETIANVEEKDYRIRPQTIYSPLDGLDISFILDFGGGDEGTLYGMFEDNDRFQIRATYAF